MNVRRDPRVLLLDIDRRAWTSPPMSSAGVQDQLERNFITIGEALNRLSLVSPELSERIPNAKDIIGFRHKLVHGYDHIDAEIVWSAAVDDLPALRKTVRSLLAGLDRAADNRPPQQAEDRR